VSNSYALLMTKVYGKCGAAHQGCRPPPPPKNTHKRMVRPLTEFKTPPLKDPHLIIWLMAFCFHITTCWLSFPPSLA
jgi:hypothetical protein